MAGFPLKSRVVLITGASSGIGEAAAHCFARQGAIPVLVARREAELNRVAAAIKASYQIESPVLAADLRQEADRSRLRSFMEQEVRQLHVLIHNAGITAHGRFDETSASVLRETMEMNFFSVVDLTRDLLDLIKKSDGPKAIWLVSTPSGLHGVPGRFAYSASKAAGHAFLETLRVELKPLGIHTGVFCPGYTRTALRTSGLSADGSVLHEDQARGAAEPEAVAKKLVRAVQKRKRLVVLSLNGFMVKFGRTLFPRVLEWLMATKLKRDFAPQHPPSP